MCLTCVWTAAHMACLFFFTEGNILNPGRDPNRGELAGVGRQLDAAYLESVERTPGARRERFRRSVRIGREDRINHLCEVFEEFRGGHTGHKNFFLSAGRLENLDTDRLRDVDLSLEQRRFRTRTCCRKIHHHRYRCFEDYHIRRVDQFCGDGFPDIPFPRHTQDWHSRRQNRCCSLLAMDRINCFVNLLDGAPDGENFRDDLDPVHDTPHYTDSEQTTLPPLDSSDMAVDDSSAYSHTSRSSSTTSTSTALSSLQTIPSRGTDDVCCVAGDLGGIEVTSNQYRTCSRMARRARHILASHNRDMCVTMYRTCCLRVAMRIARMDDRVNGESSMEDILLASAIEATSSSAHLGSDDIQDGGGERSSSTETVVYDDDEIEEGTTSRQRVRSSERRQRRMRNQRRPHRRSRRRHQRA